MGLGEDLTTLGFARVIELAPWRSVSLGGVVTTAAPAVHRGSTNTYVIQAGGRSIYFASETVLFAGISWVAARFSPIDVAFLPADGLRLRWGTPLAMDPKAAVEAVSTLRPRVVIRVLDHDFARSLTGLVVTTTGNVDDFKTLVTRQVPEAEVFALKPGCRWSPAKGVACEKYIGGVGPSPR